MVGTALLLGCLLTLAVSSFWLVPVWLVTLPFAVLMLFKDMVVDYRSSHRNQRIFEHAHADEDEATILEMQEATSETTREEQEQQQQQQQDEEESNVGDRIPKKDQRNLNIIRQFYATFPTVDAALIRMPWRIAPFVLGMVNPYLLYTINYNIN